MANLPCNNDGMCMVCSAAAIPEDELLHCFTCTTPWHPPCLSNPPALADVLRWSCPDCSGSEGPAEPAAAGAGGELVAAIRAIQADETLSEQEKARRRQALLGGSATAGADEDDVGRDVSDIVLEEFTCVICLNLPEKPVTTPCGHNFCFTCFQKWSKNPKIECGKCRAKIPLEMAQHPRINYTIVKAISKAKYAKNASSAGSAAPYYCMRNDDRPDKAFTTDRAKKAGNANASSGRIFVTVTPDHFGPILAEHDPGRNIGVRVGETWKYRLECRQWGVHLPLVAGIAGQAAYGAQSVVISGGYEDDEDHGEWFLYTGSGGKDLTGNKRTNKHHSSDQEFERQNAALLHSCLKGYPVRVVRSCNADRSSFAPDKGLRYDGIYRIEKCWRKISFQGNFKVCRFLFVRCDNEPAPWTSEEHGDRPGPLPNINKELQSATDIEGRKERPSWDYDDKEGWKWMVPPPVSRKKLAVNPETKKKLQKTSRHQPMSMTEMLKVFACPICQNIIKEPVTTPCAHNFCKTCLLGSYDSKSFTRERSRGGRTLRPQKIVKKCPTCTTDICEFLVNPQVNCDLMHAIESLQQEAAENDTKVALDGSSDSEEFCYDALNKIGGAFVRDEEKYCPNDGSDGDGDASIKNVEIKEEAMQIVKRKLFTEKEKEDNMMTSSDKRMKTSIVVKETDDGSQVVESYGIGGQ